MNFAQQILNSGHHVLIVDIPMEDIWMRDFSLSHISDPIRFRYSAAGQGGGVKGQSESDMVQASLFSEIQKAKLNFKTTTLVNDGGNWVDNGQNKAIISTKFLVDNQLKFTCAKCTTKNKRPSATSARLI